VTIPLTGDDSSGTVVSEEGRWAGDTGAKVVGNARSGHVEGSDVVVEGKLEGIVDSDPLETVAARLLPLEADNGEIGRSRVDGYGRGSGTVVDRALRVVGREGYHAIRVLKASLGRYLEKLLLTRNTHEKRSVQQHKKQSVDVLHVTAHRPRVSKFEQVICVFLAEWMLM
jgi:hypothetical protein